MKEFKPEGTPEANKKARKNLSLHLTGKPKATEKEMILAIDWWNKRNENKGLSPQENIKSMSSFLSNFAKDIEKWTGECALINQLDFDEALKKAKNLLAEILLTEHIYQKYWFSKKDRASKLQEKVTETLFWHLTSLKKSLIEMT